MTGVRGKQIVPKPYKREKSFYTSQWMPGENVRRPGGAVLSSYRFVKSISEILVQYGQEFFDWHASGSLQTS